jgi:thiol-disulfide isomerase/thioredoxin
MPMYKLAFLCFLLCSLFSNAQNDLKTNTFKIDGKLIGKDTGRITLSYWNNIDKKQIENTLIIHDGRFEFDGSIQEPVIANLRGNIKSNSEQDSSYAEFYLEPSLIKISLPNNDFKKLKIVGSISQNDFEELEKQKSIVYSEMKELDLAFSKNYKYFIKDKNNDVLLKQRDSILKCYVPFKEKLRIIELSFVVKNPNSYISGRKLWEQTRFTSIDSISLLYSALNKNIRESVHGKQIALLLKGQPGFAASDFTKTNSIGKMISLASFKGKNIVLLDFWATWCQPCRANNPHLIELYNKYNNSGFEIIGIADDDERQNEWKQAIKMDNTGKWNQVLQGLDPEDNLRVKFGVLIVPTKILINKDGIIIGRFEGIDDILLDKQLKEVFGK